MTKKRLVSKLILALVIFTGLINPNRIYAAEAQPPGLGQCHWIGGPIGSISGVKWGYSSSLPFAFKDGEGDDWAAIEPRKGEYHFDQMRSEATYVKARNKKVWLQIQVANPLNKEHNVPKWALDEGVETYEIYCGDKNIKNYWNYFEWSKIEPVWNNPRYLDQSEAVKYVERDVDKVKFPTKIAAVWDPKFRNYYLKAVTAVRKEFQQEITDGTVSAFNLMSGGIFGESVIPMKYYPWDCAKDSQNCRADVENPQCPALQSMAKIKNLTPETIAKRSNCDPKNMEPGNTVQLCTESNPSKCPTQYGSYCYVFEDYFIQAMKELITGEVEILDGLPLVWQYGNGITGTGRSSKILQEWMNSNYGSRIWFKFNGWGSIYHHFNSRGFNNYPIITRHGYEPYTPASFSREFWTSGTWASNWCNEIKDENEKPPACKQTPINGEEIGRLALVSAIYTGIVADKSSFLCMQDDFYDLKTLAVQSNGKQANQYYFNPNDNTQGCDNSEINVSTYGVGFCPGYLNYVFSQADAPNPPPSIPTSYPTLSPNPNATVTPNPQASLTPTPSNSPPLSCTLCPSGKIEKNKGNANCDSTVNNDDYLLWEDIFKKIVNNTFVSEDDKSKVDFDCNSTDITHRLDLVDFEIWRRYAY